MNFKFTCELCRKEVKRGEKFRVEVDCYESDTELHGEFCTGDICKQCTIEIENKINLMRK